MTDQLYSENVLHAGKEKIPSAITFNDEQYQISTDKSKLNSETVHEFLSSTYWAKNRTLKEVQQSIENSFCFGMYHYDQIVGFARVVTDYSTFAYLADVIIIPSYQKKGLGKWLMQVVVDTRELKNVEKWLLLTNDAQELYKKVGFEIYPVPERVMVKLRQ